MNASANRSTVLKNLSRLIPKRSLRRPILVVLGLVPLLTPIISPHNDEPFIYPFCAAVYVCGGLACLVAAHRNPGSRFQWRVFGLATILFGVAFVMPDHAVLWVPAHHVLFIRRWFHCLFITGYLAAVSFPRKVGSARIRALDHALFFLGLFIVTLAGTVQLDVKYGTLRLELGLLFNLLVAGVAQANEMANKSTHLKAFFAAATTNLWCILLVQFLVNVVDYTWLPKPYALPQDLLMPLPALLLCEFALRKQRARASSRLVPFDLNRIENVEATVLVVGSVALAFFALRGHWFWCFVFVTVTVVCYALRTQAFHDLMFRDRSQLLTKAVYMEVLATHDSLTGIGNRRAFEQTSQSYLATIEAPQIAIMLIDVDDFKSINDDYGHAAGDAILCRIAEALKETVRQHPGSCCARIGGDEFALMLLNVTMDEAQRAAETLRLNAGISAARPYRTEDSMALGAIEKASISVGVAVLEKHRLALGTLLRWADAALYRAKDDGSDCVRVIDLMEMAEEGKLSLLEQLPRVGRKRPTVSESRQSA